jgi:hypothetical protein
MGNAIEVNAADKITGEEESEKGSQVRTQTLNFEDELVEGGTQKPELFYLLQRKNFNYKKLIKLRENFLPEMRESSELVKTSGSRN